MFSDREGVLTAYRSGGGVLVKLRMLRTKNKVSICVKFDVAVNSIYHPGRVLERHLRAIKTFQENTGLPMRSNALTLTSNFLEFLICADGMHSYYAYIPE